MSAKERKKRADSSTGGGKDYHEKTTMPPQGTRPAIQTAGQPRVDLTEQASLGDYVLLEPIGAGGMGQVFKAQHQRMERIVAVKVLTTSMVCDESAVKRFHREVKAAAKLFHTNIVTAFDAGEQDGLHYLVMEYVDGWSLSELVQQEGPLAPPTAVDYVLQAARGLQYAHSLNVVHRDIKSSNLMRNRDGTIKILDMGLARLQDEGSGTANASVYHLTHSGAIMGTLAFMSPEQISNASAVDHRADIYSLGCTLYFLLSGRPVYSGDMVKTFAGHLMEPIPALREAHKDVPEALEAIYQQMLAKAPDQRYQTMEQLITDLEGIRTEGPPTAEPSSVPAMAVRAQSPVSQDKVFDEADELSTIVPQGPAIGLDFGTASSSSAHIDEAGRAVSLTNADGETTTSSIVLVDGSLSINLGEAAARGDSGAVMLGDGSGIMVGEQVLKSRPEKGQQIAWLFKRGLGRRAVHQLGDGSEYPPEVLSSFILRRVADDARSQIRDFKHVVMAVPACFDDAQRKAMQDAASIAGLDVATLISGPLAVALAFAHRQGIFEGKSALPDPLRAVIYDLGGGAFDVSVVKISPATISVLATDGDSALGGYDWDRRLMDWVAEKFHEQHQLDPRQDAAATLRLWRTCELARRALSSDDEVEIAFDFSRKTSRVHISRDTLVRLTRDLLERTAAHTRGVLTAAELDWSRIDCVLLTGGGSQMPMVHDMIRTLSGGQARRLLLKEKPAAKGAALYAAAKSGRLSTPFPEEIIDVNSRQLGVVGTDKRTGEKRNAAIIPRNTPLPAVMQHVFKTSKAGQNFLTIHILQGNSASPDDCTSIGRFSVVGLPRDLPPRSPVSVDFRLAANGRLSLTVDSSKMPDARPLFNRTSGLSADQLKFWRDWMETMRLSGQFA